eukprot:1141072-Pelagomonas_calceolata.AAC.1
MCAPGHPDPSQPRCAGALPARLCTSASSHRSKTVHQCWSSAAGTPLHSPQCGPAAVRVVQDN